VGIVVVERTVALRAQTSRAGVIIAPSRVHGRGVFAARPFEPGEVIEDCPVLLVPAPTIVDLGLDGYCFEWDEDRCAIALGYGSLYNHSWDPNARYDHDHDHDLVSYTAVRRIERGEEITINYTGDPEGRTDLWFSSAEPNLTARSSLDGLVS
jgi:SET domain-containing protein